MSEISRRKIEYQSGHQNPEHERHWIDLLVDVLGEPTSFKKNPLQVFTLTDNSDNYRELTFALWIHGKTFLLVEQIQPNASYKVSGTLAIPTRNPQHPNILRHYFNKPFNKFEALPEATGILFHTGSRAQHLEDPQIFIYRTQM